WHRQRRSIDQAGPGQEADDFARRDLRDLLAEFGKTVGVSEGGQLAGAFTREFYSLRRAVSALTQGDTDIFTARDLLLARESRAPRHRLEFLWPRTRQCENGRAYHMNEGDKARHGIAGQTDEWCAADDAHRDGTAGFDRHPPQHELSGTLHRRLDVIFLA